MNIRTTHLSGRTLSVGFESAEIDMAPDELENSLIAAEAQEDLADAEGNLDQAVILEEKAAGLEDMAEIIETQVNSKEEGATASDVVLTDLAADLATSGTDAELEVFEAPEGEQVSVESFTNRKVGTEGIKEMARSFWEAVKRLIEKAWEATIKFWRGVTDQLPGVVKSARKLAARAEDASAKVIKEKKTDISSEARSLQLEDKAPTSFKDIKLALDNSMTAAKYISASATTVKAIGGALATAIDKFDVSKGEAGLKAINSAFEKSSKGATNGGLTFTSVNNDKRFPKAYDVERSVALPGGLAVFSRSPKTVTGATSELAIAQMYRNSRTTVERFKDTDAKEMKETKIDTMSISNITALAVLVEDICGELKTFQEKHRRDLEKQANAIKAACSKVSGKVDSDFKGDEASANRHYRAAINYSTSYAAWASSPYNRVQSLVLTACRAALSTGNKSLSNYASA